MPPARLALTWLGHATVLVRTPAGRRLLVDPWLESNPRCPAAWHRPSPVDAVLVTHGHSDHTGDVLAVCRATRAAVVANPEICAFFRRKGLTELRPLNKGGTLRIGDARITMVDARHSSSLEEAGVTHYMGEAAGFIVRLDEGPTIYLAGDTALFGDMRLIADLYAPDIAVLPIGDVFTMGPDDAARACDWLRVRQVLPIHYGTSPGLTGTIDALREVLGQGVQILELQPGETAE